MTTPTLTLTTPTGGSENVSRSKEIVINLENNPAEQINQESLRVFVNDALAYGGKTAGFSLPAFDGKVYTVNDALCIKVRTRRLFNFQEVVTVRVLAQDQTTPVPNTLDSSWSFTTKPEYGALRPLTDNLQFATRCRTPFATKPMLDAFRGALVSTVSTADIFIEEALYFRVRNSQAASLLKDLRIPMDIPYRANVVGSIAEADAALAQVSVCWEGAMKELHSLGIGPRTRSLLERVWSSSYPMERVGAVGALILIAGSLLGENE